MISLPTDSATTSTAITGTVLPTDAPIWRNFGWNVVINLFYIPGAFLGSIVSDKIGARNTLAFGVLAQALVGFLMAGVYDILSQSQNIAGFAVVYGIFLSLGELGPGDNIGLAAGKKTSTINAYFVNLGDSEDMCNTHPRAVLRHCGCNWQDWRLCRRVVLPSH